MKPFIVVMCLAIAGTAQQQVNTAQQTATEKVAFEAASVKPNDGSSPGQSIRIQPGGRFAVVNMPVRALITFAYQLQGYQLIGGPAWITSDRFDIVAKIDGDAAPPREPGQPDRAMLAMRTLLAERFTLVGRQETRELDAYAMVLAKPGQRGPALTPAAQDCSPEALAARRANPPAPGSAPFFYGLRNAGPGTVSMSGMPISFYANNLGAQTGRYTIDRTGLEGRFDFTLKFAPAPPPGQPTGAVPNAADLDAPDLFTAIREQLGIKLESVKAPVDVFVIDSIDKPAND